MSNMNAGIINVEKGLARLREIKSQKFKIEEKLDVARRVASEKLTPLLDEEASIQKAIEAHCKAHRDGIFKSGKKSAQYINGAVGFRKSPPSLRITKPAEFADRAALILGTEAERYLTVKVSPDKEALKKLDDAKLKSLKIRRVSKEEFYIDLDSISNKDITSGTSGTEAA